jgi:hypothetical protein
LSRLGIFYYYGETYYALESTTHALGIETLWIETKGSRDADKAFTAALAKQANGLLIVDTGALGETCDAIAGMTLEHRIPWPHPGAAARIPRCSLRTRPMTPTCSAAQPPTSVVCSEARGPRSRPPNSI